jgi:hypothetical protein
MKLTNLLALSTLILGAADAQQDNTITLTITARTTTQSTNVTDSHGVTTTAPPRVQTRTTTDLLKQIANDTATTFPRNSKLALTDQRFVVLQGTNEIADVSGFFFFIDGTNHIFSGRVNDTNGLASSTTTTLHILRLGFDDTSVNSTNGLRFYLQGIMTETITDGRPNTNGVYTQTHTVSMPTSAGEGSSQIGSGTELPFVVSGSVSGSGSGKLQLP